MDRQTLRDWAHRFDASGPDGLLDNWTEGPKPRQSSEQMAEVARIVEVGPDREKDGIVRWRRVDLKDIDFPLNSGFPLILLFLGRHESGIGEPPGNKPSADGAHPIEIDLGFADPSRQLEHLCVSVDAC
jgi:hypothetical protein